MEPTGDDISGGWYYAEDGQQRGPMSLIELQEMARAGSLTRSQVVWREGLLEWVAAEKIPALFAHEPQPVAAGVAAPLPYAPSGHLQYYNPQGAVVVYAGFWWRFLAYLIDYAILWVPNFLLQIGMRQALNLPAQPTRQGLPMFMMAMSSASLAAIIMQWLYFALMESSSNQATLGKMACGLIVTDEAGSRISFGRATGRYFGKIVSGLILYIGFMMAGWTERKQALHDRMAGTLVIKKNLPRA
jgi:uncharacterized RDD family membrane protein YckC